MCLAVPGKIVEIADVEAEGAVGRAAEVDFQGNRVNVSLAALPEAVVGDFVLVHAGFAITILDEDEARETFETIKEALGKVPLPGAPGPE